MPYVTLEQIEPAFSKPRHRWRTVRHVAQETGLSEREVQAYLDAHAEAFDRFSVGGIPVYALKRVEGKSAPRRAIVFTRQGRTS